MYSDGSTTVEVGSRVSQNKTNSVGFDRIVFVPAIYCSVSFGERPVNKLTNGSSGKWASSCGVACVVERELCPLSGNADTI